MIDKIEPTIDKKAEVDTPQPTIGRINVETPIASSNSDGWLKYMVFAKIGGLSSLVAFLLGALIFGPYGWYVKHKQVEDQGVEIIQQAKENKQINENALVSMKERDATLTQSLKDIGFNDDEITFMVDGERSKFGAFKDKFTKYLPGKPIYVPRSDCGNDYVGAEATNRANNAIRKGYENRAKTKDDKWKELF